MTTSILKTSIKHLSTVETLTEARDLLVNEGWTQGVYFEVLDDSGVCHRCAMGALRQYDKEDHSHAVATMDVQNILLQAMREVDNDHPDGPEYDFLSVIGWNDAVGRTKEQVIEAFNLAIEIAKSVEV